MQTTNHRSPGITAIYNEVKFSQNNSVLDLGPMSPGTFQFFSSHACKIHFENLNDFVASHSLAEEDYLESLKGYLTQYSDSIKFDVILAWDYLNYLSPEGFQTLLDQLTPYCKTDTLVHLVRYTASKIPTHPTQFNVKDQYQIGLSVDSDLIEPEKKLSVVKLLKSMPNFELQHTLMGKEGMLPWISEYIFRFQPSINLKKQYSGSTELSQDLPRQQIQFDKHVSSALENFLQQLQQIDNPVVLDIGSKENSNKEQLSLTFRNLFVENVFSKNAWRRDQDNALHLKNHILDFSETTKFDAVMLWDLPCGDKEKFEIIVSKLTKNLKPNCLIWMYSFSESRRNKNIVCFEAGSTDSELKLQSIKHSSVEDYSEPGIAGMIKLMQGFQLEKHYWFKEGMLSGVSEYLFKYSPV